MAPDPRHLLLLTFQNAGLIRVLVRLFVTEKFLKAIMVCGTHDISKIGSSNIMNEFIYNSIAQKKDNIEEIVEIKARDSGLTGDNIFAQAMRQIIEKEVIVEKIDGAKLIIKEKGE